MIPVKELALL